MSKAGLQSVYKVLSVLSTKKRTEYTSVLSSLKQDAHLLIVGQLRSKTSPGVLFKIIPRFWIVLVDKIGFWIIIQLCVTRKDLWSQVEVEFRTVDKSELEWRMRITDKLISYVPSVDWNRAQATLALGLPRSPILHNFYFYFLRLHLLESGNTIKDINARVVESKQ